MSQQLVPVGDEPENHPRPRRGPAPYLIGRHHLVSGSLVDQGWRLQRHREGIVAAGVGHATTYVATKGAVLSFTKALAVDEAHYGVRVNAVSPGNVFTPLWQEAIDASPDPGRTRADGEAAQPM